MDSFGLSFVISSGLHLFFFTFFTIQETLLFVIS